MEDVGEACCVIIMIVIIIMFIFYLGSIAIAFRFQRRIEPPLGHLYGVRIAIDAQYLGALFDGAEAVPAQTDRAVDEITVIIVVIVVIVVVSSISGSNAAPARPDPEWLSSLSVVCCRLSSIF